MCVRRASLARKDATMMRTVSVDEYYLSEQDEATVLRQLGALGTSAMPPAPAG